MGGGVESFGRQNTAAKEHGTTVYPTMTDVPDPSNYNHPDRVSVLREHRGEERTKDKLNHIP